VSVKDTATPPQTAPPAADPAMFAGILGEIVDATHESTEAAPVGILAALLTGCGALVNRGPHVQVGNDRHPLLIWSMLVGRTALGAKGQAKSAAWVFLRRADPEFANIVTSGMSSGEGVLESVRDLTDREIEAQEPARSNRALFVESEFGATMARAGREGSILFQVLRQLWDGEDRVSCITKTPVVATGAHVSVHAHISPREFLRRLSDADEAGGTYNRYLICYVEHARSLPLPAPIPAAVVADLGDRLGRALAAARHVGEVGLTAEAADVWTYELYDSLIEGMNTDERWADFASRVQPMCRRIAALYAVLDGRDCASKSDLVSAAAVIRYSADSARFLLGATTQATGKAARLAAAVDTAGSKGLNRSEVFRVLGNPPRDEVEQTIGVLLASGYERGPGQHTGAGRPSIVLRRKGVKL